MLFIHIPQMQMLFKSTVHEIIFKYLLWHVGGVDWQEDTGLDLYEQQLISVLSVDLCAELLPCDIMSYKKLTKLVIHMTK